MIFGEPSALMGVKRQFVQDNTTANELKDYNFRVILKTRLGKVREQISLFKN